MTNLEALNRAIAADAAEMLTPVIERAPEVAGLVAARRPFANVAELCQAIREALFSLEEEQRIRLFRAHPELAPDTPLAMTPESQSEQARLELTSPNNAYRTKLDALNRQYRDKFGFPFITALVRHRKMESVIAEFETRLAASRSREIEAAIEQIATVSASRVSALLNDNSESKEQFSQT